MKIKKHICDICGDTIECRRHIGYKIKKKEFFIDFAYHSMDICDDCMNEIILNIKKKKSEKEALCHQAQVI